MNPATMRRVATMLMVISLGTALVFIYLFIGRKSGGNEPAAKVEEVLVVATREKGIPAMDYVSSVDGRFQLHKLPSDQVTDDMIRDLAELDGKRTAEALPPMKVVRRGQLKTSQELGLMEGFLTPGYRAITIPADRILVVGGFLKPRNRVDVLGSHERNGVLTSRVVLQNVEVLGVGGAGPQASGTTGEQKEADPNAGTVTLKVTQDQALKLYTAEQRGKLRLVLRGVDDRTRTAGPIITDEQIFGRLRRPGEPGPRVANAGSVPPVRQPRINYYPPPAQRAAGLPPAQPTGGVPFPPPGNMNPVPTSKPDREITIIRGNAKETISFKSP